MSKKKTEVAMTTYILDLSGGGQRKITVPSNWKNTFGPAVPYTDRQRQSLGERGYALRFYEGSKKDNCRAIFTDVITFRDQSLKIEEKVIKVEQQTVRKATASGAKDFVVEAKFTDWVNPDVPAEPDKEFLTLPAISDLRDVEDAG